MHKDTKWAREIIARQNRDGSWGYFHTLSEPNKYPITTEQALRRLAILGYTIDDDPIINAVEYMSDCLSGKKSTPDRREKLHDWDIFTELMLSTWIRRFTLSNERANQAAGKWAGIITQAFSDGGYSRQEYAEAYTDVFEQKPRGGRLVDFTAFYQVSLISDRLDSKTENDVFDYILHHETGIYYIYGRQIGGKLLESFASKEASRYLGAIELLSAYQNSKSKLKFVADWLNENRNENGCWDMGSGANDQAYFPLSDSWRQSGAREEDCTFRIHKLLDAIS